MQKKDFTKIPGWLTEGEGAALAELAAGKHVLEIGSYCGRSTVAMGYVAKSIACIDTFESHAIEPYERRNTLQEFLDNTKDLPCKVVPIIGFVENVQHLLAGHQFDLVFVDGDHKYQPCLRDLGFAQRLIAPGGVIAVHDYGTGYPQLQDVTKAVNKFFPEGVETRESVAIWRSSRC